MVGHDDKGMKFELHQSAGIVSNRLHHDAGDGWFAQPLGPGGTAALGFGGKASVQAERDESRMVEEMNVGESSAIECHGYSIVRFPGDCSHVFFKKARAGQGARPTEKGVTLLEMLVVVGIVAILLGVSYPSIAASIDAVRLATAADSTAAFLNSALNRAEQRHQVLELTIARRKNEMTLRSADPAFVRKLEYPAGVKIAQILPGGEDEARVFYLIPGGSSPRVGVQLVNERGAKRTVRVNPITGAPEIERE